MGILAFPLLETRVQSPMGELRSHKNGDTNLISQKYHADEVKQLIKKSVQCLMYNKQQTKAEGKYLQ